MKVNIVNEEYSSAKLMESVIKIMESTQLLSAATVSSNNESYIHTAYFCYNDNFDIYFVSSIETVHSLNLKTNESMALAIYNSNQPWDEHHYGLQIFGKCTLASPTESMKAMKFHAKRFHAYADYLKTIGKKVISNDPYKFYIFTPNKIKIFDEEVFGEENFITASVERQ